jgi:hypothetical protein
MDPLVLIAVGVVFVLAGLSAYVKLKGSMTDRPYLRSLFGRRPHETRIAVKAKTRPVIIGLSEGGPVHGSELMRIRPLRPGETSEKIVYPDGSVTDLGGILEPVEK